MNAKEAAGETPRYINRYLGMKAREEKRLILQGREAAGIIPTVRLAVNESEVSTSGMIWSKAISNLKVAISVRDWVIQKKDGYPTYNFKL